MATCYGWARKVTLVRCPKCDYEIDAAWTAIRRSRRLLGLCAICGKESKGHYRCRNCRIKISQSPKTRARSIVTRAIKTGELIRRPCEVCGDPTVQAHHEDYEKPLDVRWLCKAHHVIVHLKKTMQDTVISPETRSA